MNTDKIVFVIIPVLIVAGAFAYNLTSINDDSVPETVDQSTEEQVEDTLSTETSPFNMTGGFQPQASESGTGFNPMNRTDEFIPRDDTRFNKTEGFVPPDDMVFNRTDGFPTGRDDFEPRDEMQVNPLMEFITGVQRIADEEETTLSILELVEETRASLNTSEIDENMQEQIKIVLDTVKFMVEDGCTVSDILNYVTELTPTPPN